MPAAAVAKCLRRLRGRVGVSNIDRVRVLPPLDEIIFGYSTVTVMMMVMMIVMMMMMMMIVMRVMRMMIVMRVMMIVMRMMMMLR